MIPGFGKLSAKYMPARIDAKNHIFIPPTKALTFNAESSDDDSSFAAYIAKHEQIPEEQAKKKIKVFIDNLDKKIKEHGAVVLPDIGKFIQKKDEEKVHFLPDRSVNYNLKSYGLSEVQTFPIVRKIVSYQDEPDTEEDDSDTKVKKVKKEKKSKKEKKGGLFKLSKKAKTASLYGLIIVVLGTLLTIQLITWENRPENVFQAAASLFKQNAEEDELDQIEQMISEEKEKLEEIKAEEGSEEETKATEKAGVETASTDPASEKKK